MISPLFTLLRNGLYADREPEMIPEMSVAQWQELIETAKRQTVLGTMYQGLSRLGDKYIVPTEVAFRLVAEANRIEQESRWKEQIAWSEFQRLKAEGFHPIVLKGPAIAQLYPAPYLRESGDIDLFLRGDGVTRLRDSLQEKVVLADGSIHYDLQGVDFDLHDKYFDLHVPESKLPEVPSPYATLLMLSAHIFKHASGPGIGLRQLCDMAVAYDKLTFDPAILLDTYRKAGLLKWNVLLHSFLRKYLGLKDIFGDTVKTVNPDPLLRIIEEGGNFGHFGQTRKQALSGESGKRKLDTAKRYLKRLPFALKYAPREAIRYMIDLIRGNIDTTFIRFAIVGVINTLFGTAIMFVFYNVFHLSYWLSSASNYFFGSILSYFLNKAYTFRYGKTDFKSILRFTVNILVCYLLAYGIAKPAVAAMLTHASVTLQDNVSMGIGMVLFVLLNYFGQRFFAFKKE